MLHFHEYKKQADR